MSILVFDTETTGLNKPFCYDVGYQIIDTESAEVRVAKHFIIEQIWHNLPLFESAYYKEKRQKYIKLMRARLATLDKWGYVMQEMRRDIKKYNITDAYAYNSEFDDSVFAFNCDWYKCANPLELTAIHDIWGYASQFITNYYDYRDFCEKHQFFTDTGNYKGSAEVVYRYLTNNSEFEEDHMGLYDAQIETIILFHCISKGAEWNKDYPVNKILARPQEKPFTIKVNNNVIYTGHYIKKYARNNCYNFTVRG